MFCTAVGTRCKHETANVHFQLIKTQLSLTLRDFPQRKSIQTLSLSVLQPTFAIQRCRLVLEIVAMVHYIIITVNIGAHSLFLLKKYTSTVYVYIPSFKCFSNHNIFTWRVLMQDVFLRQKLVVLSHFAITLHLHIHIKVHEKLLVVYSRQLRPPYSLVCLFTIVSIFTVSPSLICLDKHCRL